MKNFLTTGTLLLVAALTAACAGPEENARPDPVTMSQFKMGTSRFDIVTAVGKPEMTIERRGRGCDVYKLYTAGISAGGKAAMAFTEGLTDLATLGVAEVGWSAVHAGTRPRIHTVLFCFGAVPHDDELVDVYDKDPSRESAPSHTVLNMALYSAPIATPAAATPPAAPALPPAPAGTISLTNVSREATTNGGPTPAISPTASADDLNTLSATKAATANAPVFAPPPVPPAARPAPPVTHTPDDAQRP
jgi:hypothetical protein